MSLIGKLLLFTTPFFAFGALANAGDEKAAPAKTTPILPVTNLDKLLDLGQNKLTGLQKSKDRTEVRLDKDRKATINKHYKAVFDLMEDIKDKRAADPRSKEVIQLSTQLKNIMIADPEQRTEKDRWSAKTIRMASCGQEELAGFYKTVVPLGISLEKPEIRNLKQAIADVHSGGSVPKNTWNHETATEIFNLLAGFNKKALGTQIQLTSTNFDSMGDVWNKDNNKAMKGKRKVAIFYNHEEKFQPELIGFLKKLSDVYGLSFGDYKAEDVDDIIKQTESAEMGDFIIVCPKGKLAERRIGKVFDDLAAFGKRVPDAEIMVYVGAHGSYGDAHKGQDDIAILEGARVGITHFKDSTINERFWMEQSHKLDGLKNMVPWFFDTCHSGAMLSYENQYVSPAGKREAITELFDRRPFEELDADRPKRV